MGPRKNKMNSRWGTHGNGLSAYVKFKISNREAMGDG